MPGTTSVEADVSDKLSPLSRKPTFWQLSHSILLSLADALFHGLLQLAEALSELGRCARQVDVADGAAQIGAQRRELRREISTTMIEDVSAALGVIQGPLIDDDVGPATSLRSLLPRHCD